MLQAGDKYECYDVVDVAETDAGLVAFMHCPESEHGAYLVCLLTIVNDVVRGWAKGENYNVEAEAQANFDARKGVE